jgi:hypothetical protein
MSVDAHNSPLTVNGVALTVAGRFPRIVSARSEYFVFIDDVPAFVAALKADPPGDLVTFIQPIWDTTPHHPFHQEWFDLSVLEFESYDSWWKTQLNDKTRNMVRKAAKKGVEVRVGACDDEFIKGIKEIYDESPVRQGKPFKHYQKDIETLRETHLTFADRSEFIGAYFEGKLIGFAKLVYLEKAASLMQIISMIAHRDKAPTNALLAKAVERCEAKAIHLLHYGLWSRRSFGEFKKHHRFRQWRVPRYYVPLNLRGSMALRLRMHRNPLAFLPESWVDRLAVIRNRWTERKSAVNPS